MRVVIYSRVSTNSQDYLWDELDFNYIATKMFLDDHDGKIIVTVNSVGSFGKSCIAKGVTSIRKYFLPSKKLASKTTANTATIVATTNAMASPTTATNATAISTTAASTVTTATASVTATPLTTNDPQPTAVLDPSYPIEEELMYEIPMKLYIPSIFMNRQFVF